MGTSLCGPATVEEGDVSCEGENTVLLWVEGGEEGVVEDVSWRKVRETACV